MKTPITRRTALGLGATLVAAPALITRSWAAPMPVLLELFTSQGCSSCPPADALARDMARRKDVISVSLHVDYWDYLGWRDTLANPDFSKRQRDYAQTRGDGDVYTPQMVANGTQHAVGSSERGVKQLIEAAKAVGGRVAVGMAATDTDLRIDISDGESSAATLWVMAIAPQVDVHIKRGENAGLTVSYYNVVRNLVPAGTWTGKATTFVLPQRDIIVPGCTMCIAVVQEGTVGRVMGLAQTALALT